LGPQSRRGERKRRQGGTEEQSGRGNGCLERVT